MYGTWNGTGRTTVTGTVTIKDGKLTIYQKASSVGVPINDAYCRVYSTEVNREFDL